MARLSRRIKQEEKMSVISMKNLLEGGVHFGHQTRRWNPKMKEYIFTDRNGIYIIDLEQTVKMVEQAYDFVRDLTLKGGNILFVGTKKQAKDSVREEAERCNQFYINNRWLGGTLTNFRTISSRIRRMKELEVMAENGTFDVLPKKEVAKLNLELEKLQANLHGIRDMHRLPDAIFVVDTKKEHLAVAEANKLGIPVIAIVDTNCDPDPIDYVIPGNDDAIRSIKLITQTMANAVLEGRQGTQTELQEAAMSYDKQEDMSEEEQAKVNETRDLSGEDA